MTTQEYNKVTDHLMDMASGIENAKRPAYTVGNEDVLHNFKEGAKFAGIEPIQAWAILFNKHILAISSAVINPNISQSEPLVGRFADAINYLKLGHAILRESQKENEALHSRDSSVIKIPQASPVESRTLPTISKISEETMD